MMIALPAKWLPRVLTFGVWALVAASVVAWSMRWPGKTLVVPPSAPAASSVASADPAAVARLLGSPGMSVALAVAAPNRFLLAGVVARSASGSGAALIAVDGKPAKAFSVGARIEEGLYLFSVAPRRAALAPSLAGPASMTLDLPAARPITGLNPLLASVANAPAPVPAPAQQATAPRLRTARTGDTQD
jgi:general secretion pathway protein C